ncbi:MAG: NAD-binding protein [Armatimonadetes bacterium]|nr:NAD-binding protein [Armatimonadota bacterium]
MRGHIIICGQGKVGISALEILKDQGEQVVVIARDVSPEWARRAEVAAARLLHEDARDESALRWAEVERARAIIIATDDDLTNLEVAIDAQRLNPDIHVVLRLLDADLADRACRDMSLQAVLNSARLAAPAFVAAALGQDLVRAFQVGGAFVIVAEHRVCDPATGAGQAPEALSDALGVVPLAVRRGAASEDGATDAGSLQVGDVLVTASVQPAAARSGDRKRRTWVTYGASLAAVRGVWKSASPLLRAAAVVSAVVVLAGSLVFHFAMGLSPIDAFYFTVTIVTTVGFGDFSLRHASLGLKLFGCVMMLGGASLLAVVFGVLTEYLVTLRVERVLGAPRSVLSGHTVVVGLGHLGTRVALRLHQMGRSVVAIDPDARAEIADDWPSELHVVRGDATSDEVLEQVAISRASVVLAVTDDDMVNLRVAHKAALRNSGIRTVVRLFRSSLARKLGESLLGVDVALNPSTAAGATFAAAALCDGVEQGFVIGSRLMMLRTVAAASVSGCLGAYTEVRASLKQARALLARPTAVQPWVPLPQVDTYEPGTQLLLVEVYDRCRHQPMRAQVAVEPAEQEP